MLFTGWRRGRLDSNARLNFPDVINSRRPRVRPACHHLMDVRRFYSELCKSANCEFVFNAARHRNFERQHVAGRLAFPERICTRLIGFSFKKTNK